MEHYLAIILSSQAVAQAVDLATHSLPTLAVVVVQVDFVHQLHHSQQLLIQSLLAQVELVSLTA
jgi:hypothetical protein